MKPAELPLPDQPEKVWYQQWGGWCVLLVALLLVTPGFNESPFYTRGEPREALVSQGMLLTGDWISPPAYGGLVPSKPPLLHWFAASFASLRGEATEGTTRMPSHLAYVLFAPCFFLFLRRYYRGDIPFIAALVLATSIEWFRAGIAARVDMLLAVTMVGGLLASFRWHEGGRRSFPALAVLLFAAATLTKGPVGVVLPGLIWACFLKSEGISYREILRSSLLLFLPAILPYGAWSFAAGAERGSGFWQRVYYENIARFASTMEDEPHKKSAFYLYGTLFLGLMPWMLLLMYGAIPRRTVRSGSLRIWWQNLSPFSRYGWIVSVVVIVFFSIPSGKRSVYLLPLYPFVAIGIAVLLDGWRRSDPQLVRRWCWGVVGVTALLSVAFGFQLGGYFTAQNFIPSENSRFRVTFFLQAIRVFAEVHPLQVFLAILPIGFVLFGMMLPSVRRMAYRTVGTSLVVALTVGINLWIVPAIAGALSERPFAEQIRRHVAGAEVASFGDSFYGTSFYLSQRISDREADQLTDGDLVVLFEENLSLLARGLTEGLVLHEITQSDFGIIKPENRAILVRVIKR
jgi:4-amino-4-deoxy-L-arabinose transferase-like glycosyltransferase